MSTDSSKSVNSSPTSSSIEIGSDVVCLAEHVVSSMIRCVLCCVQALESQRRPLSAAVGDGTFTVAVGFILVVGWRLTVGFMDGADSTEFVEHK